MSPADQHEVTQILQEWNDGSTEAPERLMSLVYAELRRLARSYLRREREAHTLEPTALVHEAYLRLVDQTQVTWENRAHFFGIAAQLMRRILVDHARAHVAEKRGGPGVKIQLDEAHFMPEEKGDDLLALDEVLERLAETDPRMSRVVELRFFGGLSEPEAAEVLGVSERTVRRDWQMAKLWLYRELSQSPESANA
ncbi:MAG TPA: sigma-70 family RNA polymerase sigma factor [Pyrinomonadaceae bacterium]|nr:sigma-70 family RNA polymerase sigma factor [Pyrinomonadaceae bacterium]